MSWLRNWRRFKAKENGKLAQPPTPESQLVCTVFLTAQGHIHINPAGGVGLGTLRMVLTEAAAIADTRLRTIGIVQELHGPPPVRDPIAPPPGHAVAPVRQETHGLMPGARAPSNTAIPRPEVPPCATPGPPLPPSA